MQFSVDSHLTQPPQKVHDLEQTAAEDDGVMQVWLDATYLIIYKVS
jgi:hypothetical protein